VAVVTLTERPRRLMSLYGSRPTGRKIMRKVATPIPGPNPNRRAAVTLTLTDPRVDNYISQKVRYSFQFAFNSSYGRICSRL